MTNEHTTEMKTGTETEAAEKGFFSKPWAQSLTAIVLIFGALGGFIYWQSTKDIVYIEDSYVEAPVVNVGLASSGVLNALYVKEGDHVTKDQPLALVGSETILAKDDGIVSIIPDAAGAYYSQGQTIASIVVTSRMQVVASIEENKGLDRIASGQRATFTVDAFDGKTYEGTVDRVSAVSSDTGVIFSISDKRPTKRFSVYINVDSSKYPELKNGMSAKAYVNTKI